MSNELGALMTPAVLRALPSTEIATLGSSEYAIKRLFQDGDAAVYALDSITASTRAPMAAALGRVVIIAVGAFCLAALASVWLARAISRPIDTLSRSLSEMATSRAFDTPVRPSGYSQEVDTLTERVDLLSNANDGLRRQLEQAHQLVEALKVGRQELAAELDRARSWADALARELERHDIALPALPATRTLQQEGATG